MAAPVPSGDAAAADVRDFRSERWLALSNLPGDRAFRSFSVAPRANPKTADSTLRDARNGHFPSIRRPFVVESSAEANTEVPRRRRPRFVFRKKAKAAMPRTGPREVTAREDASFINLFHRDLDREDRAIPEPASFDTADYPAVHGVTSSPTLSGNLVKEQTSNRRRIRSGFGFRRPPVPVDYEKPSVNTIQRSKVTSRAPVDSALQRDDVVEASPLRRSISAPSLDLDSRHAEMGNARREEMAAYKAAAAVRRGDFGTRQGPIAFTKRLLSKNSPVHDAPDPVDGPLFTYAEATVDASSARRLLSLFGIRRFPKYDEFNPDAEDSGSIPWQSPMPEASNMAHMQMRSEPDLSDATVPDIEYIRGPRSRFRPFGGRRGTRNDGRAEKQLDARTKPRHASLPISGTNTLQRDVRPSSAASADVVGLDNIEDPRSVRRLLFPFPFVANKTSKTDVPVSPPPDRADSTERFLAEQVNADIAEFSSLTNALAALSSSRSGSQKTDPTSNDLLEPITPERSEMSSKMPVASTTSAPAPPNYNHRPTGESTGTGGVENAFSNAFSGPVLMFSHRPSSPVTRSPCLPPQSLNHELIFTGSGDVAQTEGTGAESSGSQESRDGAIRHALSSMSSSPDPLEESNKLPQELAEQLLAADANPNRIMVRRKNSPNRNMIEANDPRLRSAHEVGQNGTEAWAVEQEQSLPDHSPVEQSSVEQSSVEQSQSSLEQSSSAEQSPQRIIANVSLATEAELQPLNSVLSSPLHRPDVTSPDSTLSKSRSTLFKPFSSGKLSVEHSPSEGDLFSGYDANGRGADTISGFASETWSSDPSILEQTHLEHSDSESIDEGPDSEELTDRHCEQRSELQQFLSKTWKKGSKSFLQNARSQPKPFAQSSDDQVLPRRMSKEISPGERTLPDLLPFHPQGEALNPPAREVPPVKHVFAEHEHQKSRGLDLPLVAPARSSSPAVYSTVTDEHPAQAEKAQLLPLNSVQVEISSEMALPEVPSRNLSVEKDVTVQPVEHGHHSIAELPPAKTAITTVLITEEPDVIVRRAAEEPPVLDFMEERRRLKPVGLTPALVNASDYSLPKMTTVPSSRSPVSGNTPTLQEAIALFGNRVSSANSSKIPPTVTRSKGQNPAEESIGSRTVEPSANSKPLARAAAQVVVAQAATLHKPDEATKPIHVPESLPHAESPVQFPVSSHATLEVAKRKEQLPTPSDTQSGEACSSPTPAADSKADQDSPEQAEFPSMENILSVPWLARDSADDRPVARSKRNLLPEYVPRLSSFRVPAEGGLHSNTPRIERSETSGIIYEPAEWKQMANNSKLSLGFSDMAERVDSAQSVTFDPLIQEVEDGWVQFCTFPSLPPRRNIAVMMTAVPSDVGKMAERGGVSTIVSELQSATEELLRQTSDKQRLPKPLPRVESEGSMNSSEGSDLFRRDHSSARTSDSALARENSEESLNNWQSPPPLPRLASDIAADMCLAEFEEITVVRTDHIDVHSGSLGRSDFDGLQQSLNMHRLPKPLKPLTNISPRSSPGSSPRFGAISAPSLGRRPRQIPPSAQALHTTPRDLNSNGVEHSNSRCTSEKNSVPCTSSAPLLGRPPVQNRISPESGRPYSARRRTKNSPPSSDRKKSESTAELDLSAAKPLRPRREQPMDEDEVQPRSLPATGYAFGVGSVNPLEDDESQVRSAMSMPGIASVQDAADVTGKEYGELQPSSSVDNARLTPLLPARRHRSLGVRRERTDSSAAFRSGSFRANLSTGPLVARRTFSMRSLGVSSTEALAAERDVLLEAVRREKVAKERMAQDVSSMRNALSNSRKASNAGERRIRELRRERDGVYDEFPRLERRLPELKDGFMFKEMALASAIRLWVDQTGGLGIDWANHGEEETVPVHIKNVSPYRRVF